MAFPRKESAVPDDLARSVRQVSKLDLRCASMIKTPALVRSPKIHASLPMLLLAAALLGCLAPSRSALADGPRPLQPEDIGLLRIVGDPQISLDGSAVAYTVTTTDLAKDKRATNLWLVRWDGSENRALTTGDNKQAHPRWSPDGKTLAFLSGRSDEHEEDQLWLLPIGGGEAERFTEIKGGVEDFAWSPDSKRLVLVVHDPDPRDPDGHEKDKKTVPPIVIDRYQFKQDMEGYLTDRYRHLRLLDLGTRKIENLTDGKHDDVLPSWSPDGQEIAFVTKRGADPDRSENWDVYVIAAQIGAKERQLTTSPENDGNPDAECAPAWSPDGQFIAYLHGADPKKIEYGDTSLAVILAKGGEARVLAPALDRNVIQPHWSADGKTLCMLVEDDGAQMIERVALEGDAAPETVVGGRREITVFGMSSGGRIVALASTPESPYEVYAAENGNLRPLSKQNDGFLSQIKLARTEETKFKSGDGTEIHGFLVHSLDAPTDRKSPALLRPHGGPQSQYACAFNFEAQLFAAHGYAVILPNPRGSTGRGEKFGLAIYASWGAADVQDDLASVDDAVARGVADPDKLGVGGWSYGGISTNYLIASTTRFKAATSGASSANMLATFGTDEYIRDLQYELGPPWEDPQKWMAISYAFYHADRIKTPTLFLCGESDFNVPLLNSEQMYEALRVLEIPTELVIYPGQFHGLTVPSYIVDRYKRYLDWYAKWIGKE